MVCCRLNEIADSVHGVIGRCRLAPVAIERIGQASAAFFQIEIGGIKPLYRFRDGRSHICELPQLVFGNSLTTKQGIGEDFIKFAL